MEAMMERANSGKKRKAVTRDVEEDPANVSGDGADLGNLDGTLREDDSQSEDESDVEDLDSEDIEDLEEDDSIASDEVPSDGEDHSGLKKTKSTAASTKIARSDADPKESDDEPSYRIEKGANGTDRYVYDEIDPDDDSEYSVGDDAQNTIGNIPLSFYDTYPHIGYNINGKKVMRPAKGEALDALLNSIDVPKGWTGLTDPNTGLPLALSQQELQLLRRVQMNEAGEEGYNPYEPMVEYFTRKTEIMPLNAAPEPKRRFVPSKHEAKRVMKIVRAIREGRILPYKPPQEEDEEEGVQNYDIWADEAPRPDHAMHMPAPKLPPPGFDESYHPPPEYLPDSKEKKAWEEQDPEDREKEYLPSDHAALRKVPGYGQFLEERFERCLDLYLAPRVRRSKLNIDPESLLPKLPSPEELKPFPSSCATLYRTAKSRVRSVAIDPSGLYVASGGDDGCVRLWELITGREIWVCRLGSDNPVNVVRWRPTKDTLILAVAAGEHIHFCIPPDLDPEREDYSHTTLNAGFGYAADSSTAASKPKVSLAWSRPPPALSNQGVHISIALPPSHTVKSLSFHASGNHLVTVCPNPALPTKTAIAIHTLSKHQTQHPFARRLKGGGSPQTAHFHHSAPILFAANQRVIRSYNLQTQSLLKIITPGARWISSFAIHPHSPSISGSDNLLVTSYDRKLLWMDLDLSPHPYKTLRYHSKAIRTAKFHPSASYPLFADGSDDGTVQVFHGAVSGDMMRNTAIVPLKVLKGHRVSGGLGVLDLDWHPSLPWLVSAGGDGTGRLWV
jgi:ribosome biogenesis protein ERB1